jgi:hypothetical protein
MVYYFDLIILRDESLNILGVISTTLIKKKDEIDHSLE